MGGGLVSRSVAKHKPQPNPTSTSRTHEDDVGESLVLLLDQVTGEEERLLEDLAVRQLPREALLARRAEFAAVGVCGAMWVRERCEGWLVLRAGQQAANQSTDH